MSIYNVYFTRQSESDFEKIKSCGRPSIHRKALELLQLLKNDPGGVPPPVKRLTGDLRGLWARRLSDEHRLVYRIDNDNVVVVSLWTHYHKK